MYWTVTQTTAGLFSVDDTHSNVQLAKVGTSPGGLQNVVVNLNMAAVGGSIPGDFSTQIDFSDAVVGPNIDQVELHVGFADNSIFFDVYDNSGGGLNVHVWDGSSQQGRTPVSGNSGTFTIVRTGTTVTGYYNGTLIFSEIRSAPVVNISFVLQLQPGSNDATSVTYDNFSLTAATVPTRPPPTPRPRPTAPPR